MLIPYFGSFKKYFDLFLYTASKNKAIDFHFFTTAKNINTQYLLFDNIFFHEDTLNNVNERANKLLGYDCFLSTPYKLCDYKNIYNLLFKEISDCYEYWGYCDTDIILGNFNDFISEECLKKHVIIGKLGHFTIIKNDEHLTQRYLDKIKGIAQVVFQSKYQYGFDENEYSYYNLFLGEEECFDLDNYISDVRPQFKFLKRYSFTNKRSRTQFSGEQFYVYHNKELIAYFLVDNKVVKYPFLYAHFQKRDMRICHGVDFDHFLIKPNIFKKCKFENVLTVRHFKRINAFNLFEFMRAQLYWLKFYLRRIREKKDDPYKYL